MNKCWHCNEELVWQGDENLSDILGNREGIQTMLVCSGCGAKWTGVKEDKKPTIKIALWGNMRSGKDTVAEMLIEALECKSLGIISLSYGSAITGIIRNYFPSVMQNGMPKPREHYQHIGQSFRELDPMVWINRLNNKIEAIEQDCDVIIITDARQENEYNDLTRQGFKHIMVDASEKVRIERMLDKGEKVSLEQLHHETEQYVKSLQADYYIDNNGNDLTELRENVWGLAKKIWEDATNE